LSNTELGRQYISKCAYILVTTKSNEFEKYTNELFGSYYQNLRSTDDMGLLATLAPEYLAPFINGILCKYCRRIPRQRDPVLLYLREEKIMGNPVTGNKWGHKDISKHARELVRRWVLRKDFFIAFDKILEHRERRDYWVKWLNANMIDDIRIFCPNAAKLRKSLGIDHNINDLSMPTLFMKIKNSLVIGMR